MIAGIEVCNFKSFKDRTTFELAPVTFLFGENNAGKSSLIDALDFFEAILVSGSPNVGVFPREFQKRSFAFERISHGNCLTGNFSIAVSFTLDDNDLESFECPALAGAKGQEWLAPAKVDLNFGDDLYSLKIKFECQQYMDEDEFEICPAPRLAKTTIELNDNALVTIDGPWYVKRKQFFSSTFVNWNLNTSHPAFPDDVRFDGKVTIGPLYPRQIPNASDYPLVFGLHDEFVPPAGVDGNIFLNYVNSLVVGAFRVARSRLANRRTISGMRIVPDSLFVSEASPGRNRWIDGSAAWDLLAHDYHHYLIDDVSKTLSTKLKCGYGVLCQKMIDERIVHRFTLNPRDYTRVEANASALRRVGFARMSDSKEEPGELRFPSEMGTGLSQVVPVITACFLRDGGLTSVSQPELHLHPRLQAELADVFIHAINREKKPGSFILETHSEHFLLRFLRRIRETTTGKAIPEQQLSADQVLVYHFFQKDEASIVTRIDVDEHGEFVQPWPDNFFELDFYERFS